MELIETSQTRKPKSKSTPTYRLKNLSGFTLMEIMVVFIIIGFLMAFGAKKLRSPNVDLKKAVRDLAGVSRELHTRAKITGVTFRLALEMNEKKLHRIWVESSTSKILFPSEAELKEKARGRDKDKDGKEKKNPFTIDKRSFSNGQKELPAFLKIKKVEYANRDEVVTEGIAYIHFLPEGLVEEAAIHLATVDDQIKWTIAIEPITGKVDVFTNEIALKDIRENK